MSRVGNVLRFIPPSEPRDHGIVTDRDSIAWQRQDSAIVHTHPGDDPARWVPSTTEGVREIHGAARTWPVLLATRDPLVIQYEGDPDRKCEPAP